MIYPRPYRRNAAHILPPNPVLVTPRKTICAIPFPSLPVRHPRLTQPGSIIPTEPSNSFHPATVNASQNQALSTGRSLCLPHPPEQCPASNRPARSMSWPRRSTSRCGSTRALIRNTLPYREVCRIWRCLSITFWLLMVEDWRDIRILWRCCFTLSLMCTRKEIQRYGLTHSVKQSIDWDHLKVSNSRIDQSINWKVSLCPLWACIFRWIPLNLEFNLRRSSRVFYQEYFSGVT